MSPEEDTTSGDESSDFSFELSTDKENEETKAADPLPRQDEDDESVDELLRAAGMAPTKKMTAPPKKKATPKTKTSGGTRNKKKATKTPAAKKTPKKTKKAGTAGALTKTLKRQVAKKLRPKLKKLTKALQDQVSRTLKKALA